MDLELSSQSINFSLVVTKSTS